MSRDFKVAVAVLVVFAIGLKLYGRFSPGSRSAERQLINLAAVEEELPKVRAVLATDQRFNGVETSFRSSDHGALAIVGTVERGDDLFQLMKAVAAARVSAPIWWDVRVQLRE